MPREKIKTLYSRNGIKSVKIEHIKYKAVKPMFECREYEHALDKVEVKINPYTHSEVRYESPLGFYYFKNEYYREVKTRKYCKLRKYSIQIGTTKYEFEYPISYTRNEDTQKIDIDMRPWDILPGYTGMPDNMITALIKEANNFIDICESYNHNVRKQIMVDLFGYEDGPKIQPNNIKILAHGFDTKESFRKRKEQ